METSIAQYVCLKHGSAFGAFVLFSLDTVACLQYSETAFYKRSPGIERDERFFCLDMRFLACFLAFLKTFWPNLLGLQQMCLV